MRLSSLLKSDAEHPRFGNLAKIRGIIVYKLSPYEQKPFAGTFSHGIPNMIRRILSNFPIVAPPFLLGYLIYAGAEWRHKKLLRKNAADYEGEENDDVNSNNSTIEDQDVDANNSVIEDEIKDKD